MAARKSQEGDGGKSVSSGRRQPKERRSRSMPGGGATPPPASIFQVTLRISLKGESVDWTAYVVAGKNGEWLNEQSVMEDYLNVPPPKGADAERWRTNVTNAADYVREYFRSVALSGARGEVAAEA